jgi:hypothetical protein
VSEPSFEVFAPAQKLSQSEMVILTVPPQKKLGHSTVKPNTNDVSVKTIQLQEGDSSKTALINAGLDDK